MCNTFFFLQNLPFCVSILTADYYLGFQRLWTTSVPGKIHSVQEVGAYFCIAGLNPAPGWVQLCCPYHQPLEQIRITSVCVRQLEGRVDQGWEFLFSSKHPQCHRDKWSHAASAPWPAQGCL